MTISQARTIARGMSRAIERVVSKAFRNSVSGVKSDIRKIVQKAILESDTAQSLRSGQLRVDFGLTRPQAEQAITRIASLLVANLDISVPKAVKRGNISQQMIIRINPNALDEILNDGRMSYISEPSGELIPWLQWLLTQGSRVIINDYEVVSTVSYNKRSRSGGGFMLDTKGGGFRVDPRHAGTPSDNFITRAIQSKRREIIEVFQRHIRRNLK